MKYMLMLHTSFRDGTYGGKDWSPEDVQANMDFMHRFNRELRESGEWVEGRGLREPGEARLVRADGDGLPATDGPFPESKEFLAGFWIVDVPSPERAYALAARASMAPGAGGAPLRMPIEVRRVMDGEDDGGGAGPDCAEACA